MTCNCYNTLKSDLQVDVRITTSFIFVTTLHGEYLMWPNDGV